jgi:hypothetical protein
LLLVVAVEEVPQRHNTVAVVVRVVVWLLRVLK